MRYKVKRAYGWTPNIAYSVGLMASDGCLQSDGRHLDLTSIDTDQLYNFSKAIGRDLNIGSKTNASGQLAYRLQFSDVAYYDFLVNAGLTPAKSKSLGRLNIPTPVYSHFLRGVFDGDGTTYGYYDPRWPNSFLYYISFAGASLPFLKYLSDENQRLCGVKGTSIRKSSRAYNLVYAKSDSNLMHGFMYKNADLFLARKKIKVENFIKQDNDATILRLRASGEIR